VLVWGDDVLSLTVARAGFWDHRGGNPFTLKATFPKVRELLEANDEAGIKEIFTNPPKAPGGPTRPFQIGGGRIQLHFERGFRP
jgi:hypothetical protein